MNDFTTPTENSADDLLGVADDPMQFAEMFDAIIYNAKADARHAAYERAAQECEAVADDMTGKEEVQAARYLAKRIRALLDAKETGR